MKGPPSTQAHRERQAVVEVRDLPSYEFGPRSLMWWGTFGLMLVESTVFGLALMMYLYLRGISEHWPIDAAPPDLLWGTLNTLILLASLWPNQLVKRAAEQRQRHRARVWMLVCIAAAAAFLAVRGMEFTALNVSWSANAYGSVVWLLLGLHTTHLVTDAADTIVLAVLMYTGPFEGKRFVDVAENAVYWYFVVASWLPIYAILYLAPRWGASP